MNELENGLADRLISRVKDIGRCVGMLDAAISNSPLFENLSKHNPYWEHVDNVADDKLHDIRLQLCALQDKLEEIRCVLNDDE